MYKAQYNLTFSDFHQVLKDNIMQAFILVIIVVLTETNKQKKEQLLLQNAHIEHIFSVRN